MEHVYEGKINNPKISVIVPIYNAEAYLERCIMSLQAQTYQNLEIILIDDGSSDGSSHICKKFLDIDKRIYYYRQDNSGVSAARNKGLDIASGKYIGFCDADDWVEPDMYEILFEILRTTGSDVSICSICSNSQNDVEQRINYKEIHTFTAREAIIEMNRGVLFAGHLCNKLLSRSIIADIRLTHNISIYEDLAFLCEVLSNSTKVSFLNVPKYHYVQVGTSALHAYRESFWSVQKACALICNIIEINFPADVDWARKTVLLGNLSLAIRASEAYKLSRDKFRLINDEVDSHISELAVSYLPDWYQKALRIFQKGWIVFNVYIFLRKIISKIRSENNK